MTDIPNPKGEGSLPILPVIPNEREKSVPVIPKRFLLATLVEMTKNALLLRNESIYITP